MKSIKHIFKIAILTLTIAIFIAPDTMAQETQLDFSKLKREDVLKMNYDDLLALPLADLMKLAEIVGVSADELLEMILNRDVTSASKKAESLFEAPLSTSVITGDEIINSGATSIEEAFRLIPGMIVRQKTSGNYDIHVRGNDNVPPKNMLLYSENTMSLVMIDGRVVYNYAHGGTLWETLPISVNDIESIEVIRGPATALYGPNAVSGAINIRTKKPENKEFKANANVQTGTLNTKQAQADVSYGISNKLKFKLSGNYDYQDRHTSEMYVFKNASTMSKLTDPGYYSYDDIAKAKYEAFFTERINNKNLGKDRYGLNGYLYYDINEDSYANISVGTQKSEAITTIFSNHNIPYSRRWSNTNYLNLDSKFEGFEFKLSYQNGTQNIEEGNVDNTGLGEAYKFDMTDFQSSLEYEWNVKNLTIRPGVSYMKVNRDDTDYVDEANFGGFFNGNKELSSFAYFLRADYKATEKLRFIAALRGDKYETPDVNKFTYQFITSYKFNEKNIVRAVYSRANRGPFMTDAAISYRWNRLAEGMPIMQFDGNSDLDLAVMDMFEIGYNLKPSKNIQIGIEFYHTEAKDFGFLTPEGFRLEKNPDPKDPNGSDAYIPYAQFTYLNLPTKSIQNGLTVNFNWVLNEKLQIRPFFSFQKTELENFVTDDATAVINKLATEAQTNLMSGKAPIAKRGDFTTENVDHKSTPSFYGGVYVNYTPVKKLNINMNTYFYGEQEFVYQDETKKVDPKVILNAKVSYNFWKNHKVFVNARNMISDNNEFAFTDKIGATYLVGLNLSF